MNDQRFAWQAVGREIDAVLDQLSEATVTPAFEFLAERPGRWFVTGQGRSGLVGHMTAMRLMHLGRPAHVVGETTAPAVEAGDHVIALSKTGTTAVTIHLSGLALAKGADLLVVTSAADSPLAELASSVLVVPSAPTVQFGGSLFEQSALLILDSMIIQLAGSDPEVYEAMGLRHANLQ